MAKQSDFNAFLSNIEPSASTVSYISSIQTNLRSFLKNHKDYKEVHVDTFLSGSYAKHTSIRPAAGDKKRDVDIIVVTSYSADKDSADVLEELRDVLLQKNEYSTATIQRHSVGIEMVCRMICFAISLRLLSSQIRIMPSALVSKEPYLW